MSSLDAYSERLQAQADAYRQRGQSADTERLQAQAEATFSQPAPSGGTLRLRPGQRLTDSQLMQLLYQVGFRGNALITAFAVAKAESGGNSSAHNPNANTGDNSFGLFQINMLGSMGPARRRQFGISSNQELFDPVLNAEIAYKMSNGGQNWSPWSVHPHSRGRGGAGTGFERHLGTAQQTLANLQSAGQLEGVTIQTTSGRSVGGTGEFTGGGGGGVTGVDTMFGIPAEADPRSVKEIIEQDFGYIAWAMDHPELGPLLTQAAEEGWDGQTLRGALHRTDWWQSHSEANRLWAQLISEDPAEAARQLDQTRTSIASAAERFGISLEENRAGEIAETALRENWTDQEIQRALAAEARYDPTQPRTGQLGSYIDQVVETAGTYMVNLSGESAFDWAQRMLSGSANQAGMEAHIADLARGRFPHLTEHIDRGITPRQFFDPYREQAAQLLELNPAEVDMLSDRRFQKVLDPVADDQGRGTRMMTMSEWADYLRRTPEWNQTRDARERAANLGATIGQTFGAVRFS